MDTTKPPRIKLVRRAGSKTKLVSQILAQTEGHNYKVVVDACMGSAIVGLAFKKQHSPKTLVLNDLDAELINLCNVLKNKTQVKQLEYLLGLTPYSRAEFEQAKQSRPKTPVDQALKFLVLSWQTFNSNRRPYFGAQINRAGFTGQINQWNKYKKTLKDLHSILNDGNTIIEQRSAVDVLKAFDHEHTLHYVDPPYEGTTNHYGETIDYIELVGIMLNLKGSVMYSCYPIEHTQPLLDAGWECIEKKSHTKTAKVRLEQLWLNPALLERQDTQKLDLFSEVTGG